MSDQLEQWRHMRRKFTGYHFSDLGRILGPRGIVQGMVDHNGYMRVTVVRSGKKYRTMAHRLIAMAWLPKKGKRSMVINHKDCNKLNNRPDNLEWVTQKENIAHSWRMGRQKPARGEQKKNAKLNKNIVLEMRARSMAGESTGAIAVDFGVAQSTAWKVVNKLAWRHVA